MKERIVNLLRDARDNCPAHKDGKHCHPFHPREDCPYKEYGIDCYLAVQSDHLIANNVVVREKGEWVFETHDDGYGEFDLWHCSRCGVASANKRNYCHYCGADMRNTQI